MSNQLVFIDPHVANYQSLIDQLGTGYSLPVLSSEFDGLTRLANYVPANPGFDAIHLISHGSPGQEAVETSPLSEATVSGHIAQLNQIDTNLNAGADFPIYGCDVAHGAVGQQLTTEILRISKLNVAASTNPTGSTGDWAAEFAAHSGDGDRRIRDRDRVCRFERLRGSEYRLRG